MISTAGVVAKKGRSCDNGDGREGLHGQIRGSVIGFGKEDTSSLNPTNLTVFFDKNEAYLSPVAWISQGFSCLENE
jgi:hypothetical protein